MENKHPLIAHLKATGETVGKFAARVGMSRVHVHRIISGDNTTVEKLERLSAATGGAVPVSAFFPAPRPQEQGQ